MKKDEEFLAFMNETLRMMNDHRREEDSLICCKTVSVWKQSIGEMRSLFLELLPDSVISSVPIIYGKRHKLL